MRTSVALARVVRAMAGEHVNLIGAVPALRTARWIGNEVGELARPVDLFLPAEAVVALLRAHLGCRDDPKWGHNGYGKRCHEYEYPRQPATPKGAERGAGWCAAGALKPGSEWAGGASFRYPERACCACGGGIRDSG